jgi:hypothetical protein
MGHRCFLGKKHPYRAMDCQFNGEKENREVMRTSLPTIDPRLHKIVLLLALLLVPVLVNLIIKPKGRRTRAGWFRTAEMHHLVTDATGAHGVGLGRSSTSWNRDEVTFHMDPVSSPYLF